LLRQSTAFRIGVSGKFASLGKPAEPVVISRACHSLDRLLAVAV